jgi:hypothetical protein
MIDPSFLSMEDILSIHEQEIKRAGGKRHTCGAMRSHDE